MSIHPKHENAHTGFSYTVSEEQVEYHKKRTLAEIFTWLEETQKFVYSIQTPEERKRSRQLKNKSVG